MKIVRSVIGSLILMLDRLTAPKPPVRTPEEQKKLDEATAGWTLYHLLACPFCVKVRRQILRQGLTIRMRDIARDEGASAELLAGGKIDQVPCLRIDRKDGTEWMYESDAINAFLKRLA